MRIRTTPAIFQHVTLHHVETGVVLEGKVGPLVLIVNTWRGSPGTLKVHTKVHTYERVSQQGCGVPEQYDKLRTSLSYSYTFQVMSAFPQSRQAI